MSKRQEALDKMQLHITEDSKMPLWVPFLSAISFAVMALIYSTKDGYLFVVTLFIVLTSVLITFGMSLVITRIYLKPIVELWLAAESEFAEEEKKTE